MDRRDVVSVEVEAVEDAPVVSAGDRLTPEDEALLASVMEAADAPNTVSAYRTDLRQFGEWCRAKALRSFDAKKGAAPKVVALWATHLGQQGMKSATIERKLAAISSAHTRLGLPSPCREPEVKRTLSALRRTLGVDQDKVLALEPEHLRRMVATARNTVRWKRDRALLFLGFACAMRRSELVAVKVEHLVFGKDTSGKLGLSVFVPSSKTDQEGRGEWKHVPAFVGSELCPVRALRAWLKRSGITTGYVFRRVFRGGRIADDNAKRLGTKTVAKVVRKAVKRIGEDSELFGGHSLRAGMVTAAKAAGVDEAKIMRQSGHKNPHTLRGYDRPRDVFGPSNPLHGLLGKTSP